MTNNEIYPISRISFPNYFLYLMETHVHAYVCHGHGFSASPVHLLYLTSPARTFLIAHQSTQSSPSCIILSPKANKTNYIYWVLNVLFIQLCSFKQVLKTEKILLGLTFEWSVTHWEGYKSIWLGCYFFTMYHSKNVPVFCVDLMYKGCLMG